LQPPLKKGISDWWSSWRRRISQVPGGLCNHVHCDLGFATIQPG
jgi:hypothetical protein